MIHSLNLMKSYFPHLNRREITESDCWRFVERRCLKVETMPLIVNGYYGRRYFRKRWRDYILLDSKLRGLDLLKTFLHEIAHVCLHVPMSKKEVLFSRRAEESETKFDKEADAFMLVGLMPQPRFFEMTETPFEELHPLTVDLLIQRQRLFEQIQW